MKFLIDGHRDRVTFRAQQWPAGVAGQLLTPLTNYKRGQGIFAVDNGAFTSLKIRGLSLLLKRNLEAQAQCLFVCIPDKVGSHLQTVELWHEHHHLAEGWRKAFVVQDGFAGLPEGVDVIFLGGTTEFKDSHEALQIVTYYCRVGLHVHIGRVNGPERFLRFNEAGAHTCDGSGVSRYDHMIVAIKRAVEARNAQRA